MSNILSLYLLPPVLSLVCGIYLSVLALAKRAINTEKILFALICLWYSLLAPVFICHHLISDPALILRLERSVHFFYVYFPVILILFFHHIFGIRRKYVVTTMLVISFLLSLTTQSPYYFNGLNKYGWGYIAKGGIAFQIFGLCGAVTFFYCVYCFTQRFKVETDPRLRLKFQYMMFSFGLAGLLTFMNLPAIHGYDLYPLGNFSFLPLAILAYGILKHRLLQIRSLLTLTLTRVLLSLLILLPNYYLFVWGVRHLEGVDATLLFCVVSVWFWFNFLYVRWVYFLIKYWFDKARLNLQRAESKWGKQLLELRSTKELSIKINSLFWEVMSCPWAKLYVYDETEKRIQDIDGGVNPLSDDLMHRFTAFNGIFERRALHQLTVFSESRAEGLLLLRRIDAAYVVALIHDGVFVGLLALADKENRQPINPYEAAFIKNITKPLALATANAVLFQSISTLKDSLQSQTETLTREVEERTRAEQNLKALQAELQETNIELEKAILQANEMHAKVEISNYVLTQEMEERKRAEAALRQSESTYRLITENSTDVIWTIDMNDQFTYLSPSVFQLLDYSPEEMIQLKISAVLTARSYQLAKKTIVDDFKRVSDLKKLRRKDRFLELEQVRKDGTTVWTEVNTRFIEDAEGNITGILGVTRDISERRKSEQSLLYMAHHDALTGLYNRKAFMDLLESEVKYAQRYQTGLALLFFDMNKFKLVNDTYGHEVGDEILKQVAGRLRTSIRETDLIARLGGDEFTIILRNPEKVMPEVVANRITKAFDNPFAFRDETIDFVSASIGIATFPADGHTASALLKSADLAMYRAKKDGADWLYFEKRMIRAG